MRRDVVECEPVWRCRRCNSLYVLYDPSLAAGRWDGGWCGRCGSTDVEEVPYAEWEAEERRRGGDA